MTTFAYCPGHQEITAGQHDSSKGFLLDPASEHYRCDLDPFDPTALAPPLFATIARLGAGLPVTDNQITLFRLGLAMEDRWHRSPSTAPAAASTSPMSPAPARASAASTRSARASAPTSITDAQPDLLDLLQGA